MVSLASPYDTGTSQFPSYTPRQNKTYRQMHSAKSYTTYMSPLAKKQSRVCNSVSSQLLVRQSNLLTAFKKPPFRASEDGWGEFEMQLTLVDFSGKSHTISHDLNFQTAKYEVKHVLNFRNPKAGSPLLDKLRNSGPVPGDNVNGDKKRQSEIGAAPKKKKGGDGKSVDMDLLADGLQKLEEDDLLQVVQMVHDNKSEDSWMRNDVERE